jgi:hypothetical protein
MLNYPNDTNKFTRATQKGEVGGKPNTLFLFCFPSSLVEKETNQWGMREGYLARGIEGWKGQGRAAAEVESTLRYHP